MGTAPTVGIAPGALPLFGHTLSLLYDPLGFLTSLPNHGDLLRIQIGPFEAIVVCTPELVRQVLLDDRIFDKAGPVFDRARDAFGDGLATCPHGMHRRQRRLVQPAFHPARFPGYAQVMSKPWAQPVVAFDLEGSVGQDSRRARDVDVSGSGGNLSWSGRGLAVQGHSVSGRA